MMGTLDVPRGDIEPGAHTETTEVLLSLLSQNKALGGKNKFNLSIDYVISINKS